MKIFKSILFFSILLIVASCSNKGPSFTIEGKITDADTTVLYLERRDLSSASVLDSVKLTSDGSFKFTSSAPQYPELYILRLGNEIINLAIDSTETVKVDASKIGFATNYKVEGSNESEQLKTITLAQYKATREINNLQAQFDKKEIDETKYIEQINNIAAEYKEMAGKIIFSNLKSPVAYFALFQKVGGLLFFDPYDKSDYKFFGAVATSWDTNHPTSPRSEQLKKFTLQALKVRKQSEPLSVNVDNLNEISSVEYYNVELPDINNKKVNTSDLRGKVVLIDFTVYQTEDSPLHNIALNKIYSKHKDNFEIYQIALDYDTHFWRNAAVNIPWVAVHDEQSINSPLLMKFNVQQLPSMYLINKDGEMVKRIMPNDNLEAEIQKLL